MERKLPVPVGLGRAAGRGRAQAGGRARAGRDDVARAVDRIDLDVAALAGDQVAVGIDKEAAVAGVVDLRAADARLDREEAVAGDREIERRFGLDEIARSEEHTSELQSLMRISYAVFCLKKKNKKMTSQIAQNISYKYTTIEIETAREIYI